MIDVIFEYALIERKISKTAKTSKAKGKNLRRNRVWTLRSDAGYF